MPVLPIERLLARGVVLRARLDQQHLSDPKISTRHKYIVVLNCDWPADPIYFAMTTSQVERFESLPHLKADVLPLNPGSYDFLDRPTVLDLTDVQQIRLADLKAMVERKIVTVVGRLLDDDLTACGVVIRASRHIEPRLLPVISCPDR